MALILSTLQNDLLDAFQSMTDGDDDAFADKVSSAVDRYAETGLITTADSGGVPSGAFTGAGTGNITCDAALCKNILLSACSAMPTMTAGGNDFLAAQLALGIHTMVSAGQVRTAVTGTVVPPGSPPAPMAGNASGTMTGLPAPMQAAFQAAFTAMDTILENGDQYMAEKMAVPIDAYLKAAVVATQGGDALVGSVGAGNMV
jgi:hypothetical protein